jgi:hypothetical protein
LAENTGRNGNEDLPELSNHLEEEIIIRHHFREHIKIYSWLQDLA